MRRDPGRDGVARHGRGPMPSTTDDHGGSAGAGVGAGAGAGVGTGGGEAPGVSLSFDEIKRYLGSEGAKEGVPAKLNGKTEVR